MQIHLLKAILFILVSCSLSNADTIILKDGTRYDVEKVWKDEGKYKFVLYGVTQSYGAEKVEKVIYGELPKVQQPKNEEQIEYKTTNENKNNSNKSEVIKEKQDTRKWYQKGNLHKSTIKEWKTASYDNKLATASDWALVSPKIKKAVMDSGNIDNAKIYAYELITCIDTAVRGISSIDSNSSAEIATLCMAQLGWLN